MYSCLIKIMNVLTDRNLRLYGNTYYSTGISRMTYVCVYNYYVTPKHPNVLSVLERRIKMKICFLFMEDGNLKNFFGNQTIKCTHCCWSTHYCCLTYRRWWCLPLISAVLQSWVCISTHTDKNSPFLYHKEQYSSWQASQYSLSLYAQRRLVYFIVNVWVCPNNYVHNYVCVKK